MSKLSYVECESLVETLIDELRDNYKVSFGSYSASLIYEEGDNEDISEKYILIQKGKKQVELYINGDAFWNDDLGVSFLIEYKNV